VNKTNSVHKAKQIDCHGGRQAAVRFESSMHKILAVSKERSLELEKQAKAKRSKSRGNLPG